MAYLSSYLSSSNAAGRRRSPYSGTYPVIRMSNPYSQRYGANVGGNSSSDSGSALGLQDVGQAMLAQRSNARASLPSFQFQEQYNYDPILQRIQALGAEALANAKTDAAQLRKQAVIGTGDVNIARQLGFDENTINAAGQNPESEAAMAERDYQDQLKQLEEAMNAQNLGYSGEYASNLSRLAQSYASFQGSIGERLRGLLSGVDQGLLSSQEAARQEELQAYLNGLSAYSSAEGFGQPGSGGTGNLETDPVTSAGISKAGYRDETVAAAAATYADLHGYSPDHYRVMQEGTVTYQNGIPGIMIKYTDANGLSTTEWTPLPPKPDVASVDNGTAPGDTPDNPPVIGAPAPTGVGQSPLTQAIIQAAIEGRIRRTGGGAI